MSYSILGEYCFSCAPPHFYLAKAAIAAARHLAGKQIKPIVERREMILLRFHPFQTIPALIRTNVPSNSILTGPFQPVCSWSRTSANDQF